MIGLTSKSKGVSSPWSAPLARFEWKGPSSTQLIHYILAIGSFQKELRFYPRLTFTYFCFFHHNTSFSGNHFPVQTQDIIIIKQKQQRTKLFLLVLLSGRGEIPGWCTSERITTVWAISVLSDEAVQALKMEEGATSQIQAASGS